MATIRDLHDIRQKVSDPASQYGAKRIFLFDSYAKGGGEKLLPTVI